MTTTNFRRPLPVDDCPRLEFPALLERFPHLRQAMRDEYDEEDDDSELLERFDGEQVLLIEGDAELDAAWLQSVADAGVNHVAITGSARADSPPRALLYVGGDLHCHDWQASAESSLVVDGRIVARDCVVFFADDDEATRQPRPARIETPWLFSWFFSIEPLQLSPDTAVFILADHDHGQSLKQTLPNPVINWHEAIHLLRDELQYVVEAHWHDAHSWRLDAIREALAAGRPVLRDGVSLAALPICQRAEDLARIGERRAAYLQLRRAAAIAPAFYRVHARRVDLLFEAGAFEQALACARRAADLFPARQTALADGALNDGALAALRAQRFDDAIEIATRSLARHTGEELAKTRATAHRLRGEALFRRGDADAARRDLEAAIALNPRQNGARWMLGLWHHLHGDASCSRELHDAAAGDDDKFAPAYDTHRDTDFLHAAATRVDWDDADLDAEAPAAPDEAFWRRLIEASGPGELVRVPVALRSGSLCLAAVSAAPAGRADFAVSIPAAVFTREMALELARRSAANLAWIPPSLVDKALCLATPEGQGFELAQVPADLIDADICRHAIRAGERIANIPPAHVDTELCREAVARHVYDIDHVPPALRTEDLYVLAIAHGGCYYIENHLPSRWRTNAMFKRAIGLHKAALDGIPGKLFDAELFAHAQALYGQDADWPAIVERHGQAACRSNEYGKAAEHCWRVFWDEPFMLAEIARDGYNLAPYDIPPELFTPAITEACHRHEKIHLDRIPPAFVTEAMCESFIREYADLLREVPLERRSVDVCRIAVIHERAQLAAVPAALHAEVMDELLGHLPPGGVAPEGLLARAGLKFGRGKPAVASWKLLERGRGELMREAPDFARAEADLRAVAASPVAEDEAEAQALRDEAQYLLGYIAYRQGRTDDAEALRRRAGRGEDWDAYAGFDPKAGKPTANFEAASFDRAMHETERATESGDLAAAWEAVIEAERLLTSAGVQEPAAWAHVLDKQRWLSFELGRLDVNEAVCRAAVARLGPVPLWAYLPGDNTVRHTLRSALHRLAMLTLDADPPASLAALQEAQAQMRRVWSLRGPTEDDDVLEPFREGRDRLRERIAATEG